MRECVAVTEIVPDVVAVRDTVRVADEDGEGGGVTDAVCEMVGVMEGEYDGDADRERDCVREPDQDGDTVMVVDSESDADGDRLVDGVALYVGD